MPGMEEVKPTEETRELCVWSIDRYRERDLVEQ